MQLCKGTEIEFGPFPIPGVDNVTFAGLTEHPDGGFTAMIAMKKGAEIPEHGHKHFEETYVVSGVVNCAGTTLETGDYIRVNDDEKHSVTAMEDTKLLVMVHQGVVVDGVAD